ncbi:MAG: helix-turn-helix domain-containing protein [Caulobacter sp.]|nr:helix-turn-helix domain-containing protein [Caulobacter sp.]
MNGKSPEGGAVSWLRRAPGDLDRIEGCFSGVAYSPHRHDSYAIGVTLDGVQTFDYRGATRHSLQGQLVVLHPDELHDGRAGDGTSFRYRTAYISPGEISQILDGAPLPFIREGVSGDGTLRRAITTLLGDLERPLEPLAQADALFDLATALSALSGEPVRMGRPDRKAVEQARQVIEDRLEEGITLAELEVAAGCDRWSLSRDFRSLCGTSPYRYLTYRRLDRARRLLSEGLSGAETAIACGFSDQSHLVRMFRQMIGLTPQAWLRASRQRPAQSFYTPVGALD